MKNELIWSYFIQLGEHMWSDPLSPAPKKPAVCGGGRYREAMSFDFGVHRRVLDQLPSFGINMAVIDIGEGLRYESHPELATSTSWSADKLRQELDYMRSLGIEPIPKLNFSACHDAWLGEYSLMMGTKKYYEVVKDVIRETAEVFGNPRFFHLGMDEEDVKHPSGITAARCEDLWWRDLYFLFDEVEKYGARPWIWSDHYWRHPHGWEQKMPKDCVQSNWQYCIRPEKDPDGTYPGPEFYQAYVDFSRMGYDQIPCSSDWCHRQCTADTTWMFLEDGLCDEHLLGFMTVPWVYTTEEYYYTMMSNAQHMKEARDLYEAYTPETREELILTM